MSKISIKTDFVDGEKLFATQLNNNFKVIQEGIDANETNLQEVIDRAIVRLDRELIAITNERGWDWNDGSRVSFYKGSTADIEDKAIVDGQLLYNTDTGETSLDQNGQRVVTGSGNVVAVQEEVPRNIATKLWVQPSHIRKTLASNVVDSMSGREKTMSPSIRAVKDYVGETANTISTESAKTLIATAYRNTELNNVGMAFVPMLELNSTTDKLTLVDGGIRIGSGISKVKVSGNVFGCPQGTNNNVYFWMHIQRIRSGASPYTLSIAIADTTHWFATCAFAPQVVDVQEGDIIKFYKMDDYPTNIRVGASTYLTVEVIK